MRRVKGFALLVAMSLLAGCTGSDSADYAEYVRQKEQERTATTAAAYTTAPPQTEPAPEFDFDEIIIKQPKYYVEKNDSIYFESQEQNYYGEIFIKDGSVLEHSSTVHEESYALFVAESGKAITWVDGVATRDGCFYAGSSEGKKVDGKIEYPYVEIMARGLTMDSCKNGSNTALTLAGLTYIEVMWGAIPNFATEKVTRFTVTITQEEAVRYVADGTLPKCLQGLEVTGLDEIFAMPEEEEAQAVTAATTAPAVQTEWATTEAATVQQIAAPTLIKSSKTEQWKKDYAKRVLEWKSESPTTRIGFRIINMDENPIPELIVYEDDMRRFQYLVGINGKLEGFGEFFTDIYISKDVSDGLFFYTNHGRMDGVQLTSICHGYIENDKIVYTDIYTSDEMYELTGKTENYVFPNDLAITNENIVNEIFNYGSTSKPHPYATALAKYLDDEIVEEGYEPSSDSGCLSWEACMLVGGSAILCDINGDGVEEMLTLKHERRNELWRTNTFYTLFYFHDGELREVSLNDPYSAYFISKNNTLVSYEISSDFQIYTIEDGEVVKNIFLGYSEFYEFFTDDPKAPTQAKYEDESGQKIITFEQYEEYLVKLGLDGDYFKDYGHGARPTEAMDILALTTN